MKQKQLWTGIGIGMAAGAALGMIIAPQKRPKSAVGRAFRAAGNIAEGVAGMLR